TVNGVPSASITIPFACHPPGAQSVKPPRLRSAPPCRRAVHSASSARTGASARNWPAPVPDRNGAAPASSRDRWCSGGPAEEIASEPIRLGASSVFKTIITVVLPKPANNGCNLPHCSLRAHHSPSVGPDHWRILPPARETVIRPQGSTPYRTVEHVPEKTIS